MNARQRFRADLERYYCQIEPRPSRWGRLRMVLETEGIWAIWCLRFGQYLHEEAGPLVRALLKGPYWFAWKLVRQLTDIHLFPTSSVGPGLYIGHHGGIWINPRTRIGADCNFSQGVTIGVAGRDRSGGPVLGDRVWLGPHAVVAGKITIGSGAVIGANSLVVANVAENGVVIGVPAKTLGYWGSASLIQLPADRPKSASS